MKKLFLLCAVIIAGLVNAQIGNLKVGAHVGLPTGDLADGFNFNAGVDLAYIYNVNDQLNLGLTTGYSNYFGDEMTIGNIKIDVEDAGIVPIAATAEFLIMPQLYLGADLGYAFFTNKDSDSGAFYYQPKVGYKFGLSEIYVGYKGLSKDSENLGSINLGYAYSFSL